MDRFRCSVPTLLSSRLFNSDSTPCFYVIKVSQPSIIKPFSFFIIKHPPYIYQYRLRIHKLPYIFESHFLELIMRNRHNHTIHFNFHIQIIQCLHTKSLYLLLAKQRIITNLSLKKKALPKKYFFLRSKKWRKHF